MPKSRTATLLEANAALLVAEEFARIEEFFTPDYVVHGTGKVLIRGHAGILRHLRSLARAFTDREVEVELLVKSKDRVAWQRTLRAKHTGAFRGFPATGRKIVWRDLFASRFEGERLAEDWAVSDLAEQLLRARR